MTGDTAMMLDEKGLDAALTAYGSGIVREPSPENSRGYMDFYKPRVGMANAIRAYLSAVGQKDGPVARYDLMDRREFAQRSRMARSPDGEYVRFSDYAALKAKLDEARLTIARFNGREEYQTLMALNNDLLARAEAAEARLAAVVETRAEIVEQCARVAERRYEVWQAGDGFADGEGLTAVSCDVTTCENIAAAIRNLEQRHD